MYAFLDRSIDELGDGSRFVLWAMRGWIYMLAQRKCPPALLAPAFARMGVLPALPDFHKSMILLNRDGLGSSHSRPLTPGLSARTRLFCSAFGAISSPTKMIGSARR